MPHILDNPAWNALISGNKNLSYGNDEVKYFDREVSPFVAMKEISEDHFKILHELLPHSIPVLFISPERMEFPNFWSVRRLIKGIQMIYEGDILKEISYDNIIPLKTEDVPQMISLTKLTDPGPFGLRTIEFGHYHGIFDRDRLVAMAGQRLHVYNYTEVSAVCTHPDHTGKGYARQLLKHQIKRMQSEGNVPYLHVRSDNDRAIKVYADLGFKTRREIYFYVIQKPPNPLKGA